MRKNAVLMAAVVGSVAASPALAATVIMSDSFSRSPDGATVGTQPSRDTSPAAQSAAAAGWVSNWGANNNNAGGSLVQTYTTYTSGGATPAVYKVDGSNGISGNYLNNGNPSLPLKYNQSTTTTTEAIGLPGFAWVQINHDFASNTTVTSAEKLRVSFDLYRSANGNIGWYLGQSDATGVNNGTDGSPATKANNDISFYWRGGTTNTYGLRDNGAVPAAVAGIANYDAVSYATGTNFASSIPASIVIEITGTDFSFNKTSLVELWVNGIAQDLNGTSNAGNAYTMTWDNGGAAYMGFGSNSTPVEGTAATPVYRASGIDNLVIAAVPEPTALGALALSATLLRRRR